MDLFTIGMARSKTSGGAADYHICSSSEYSSVTGLPTVSNPVPNRLYLVPIKEGAGNNHYNEYYYKNGNWELFGNGIKQIEFDNSPIDGSENAVTSGGVHAALSGISGDLNELEMRVNNTISAVGSPLIATTAADMTNIDKVYVYQGEETGYTAGNWYYYNGTAWASGGVYNAAAVNTDKTLSVENSAADAKAVGDSLDSLINVSTTQPSDSDNRLWINPDNTQAVEVPTQAEMVAFETSVESTVEGLSESFAPKFDDATDYVTGDYVVEDGVLYKFKSDHAAGAWTGNDVTAVKVMDEVDNLKEDFSDMENVMKNLYYPANDVSFWEQGGITIGGNKQAASNRIRTVKTFDNKVKSITIADNYKALLYAYDNNTYIGCWNGTEFIKSGSAYQFTVEIDMSNFSNYGYAFKLVLFITRSDISPESGYDKVYFITDDLNYKVAALSSKVTATEEDIIDLNTNVNSLNSNIESVNGIITALQDGETETGNNIEFVIGTINTSDGITEKDTAGRFCKTARDIFYSFDTNTKIVNNNNAVRLIVYRYNPDHSYIGYVNVEGIGVYYTKENEVYRFGGRYSSITDNISPDIMDVIAYTIDLSGFRAPTSNTLYKKKIVNLGDSIFGLFNPPTDISTFLEEYTGAKCYNCGFGGTYAIPRTGGNDRRAFDLYNIVTAFCDNDYTLQDTVYDGGTSYPETYAERLATLKSIDFSEIDIITIAIGTNDYNANHVVNNSENLYDSQTYNGALRYCLEKIWTTFPHIKIVLCTPIFRTMSENPPTYAFETENEVGETLLGYTNGMKTVGNEYNLTVIDNSTMLGINKLNRSNYFPSSDGTHPNENGRRLIARHISKIIF